MKNETIQKQKFSQNFKKFLQNSMLKNYNDLKDFQDLAENFNFNDIFKTDKNVVYDNIINQAFQYLEILNFYMNYENAIQVQQDSNEYVPSILNEELKNKDFNFNKMSFVSSVLKSDQSEFKNSEKNVLSIQQKVSQQIDFNISNYLDSQNLDHQDSKLNSFINKQENNNLQNPLIKKSQNNFSINTLGEDIDNIKQQSNINLIDTADQKIFKEYENNLQPMQSSMIYNKQPIQKIRKFSQMDKILKIKIPQINKNITRQNQSIKLQKQSIQLIKQSSQRQKSSLKFGRNSQMQSIKYLFKENQQNIPQKNFQSFSYRNTQLKLPNKANSHFYQIVSDKSFLDKKQSKLPLKKCQFDNNKQQNFQGNKLSYESDFSSYSSSNSDQVKSKNNYSQKSDTKENSLKLNYNYSKNQNIELSINNNKEQSIIQHQSSIDLSLKSQKKQFIQNDDQKNEEQNLNLQIQEQNNQLQLKQDEENIRQLNNEIKKISKQNNLDQQINKKQLIQQNSIDSLNNSRQNQESKNIKIKAQRRVLEKCRSEQHKQGDEQYKRKKIKSQNFQEHIFDKSNFDKDLKVDLKQIFNELNLEEKIKNEIRKKENKDFCNQRTIKKKKKKTLDREENIIDQKLNQQQMDKLQKQDQYNFNINITFVFKNSQKNNKNILQKNFESIKKIQKKKKLPQKKNKTKFLYKPKKMQKNKNNISKNINKEKQKIKKLNKSTNRNIQQALPQIQKLKRFEISPKKIELKKNILNINKNLNEQIQKLQLEQNQQNKKIYLKNSKKNQNKILAYSKKKYLSPYDLKYSNQILKRRYNMKIVAIEPEKILTNKNIYSMKYKFINLNKKRKTKQDKKIQKKN